MDVNHLPPDSLIFEMFRSHKHFGLKMRHELKRAERYCEFVSLIVIDLKDEGNSISDMPSKFAESLAGISRIDELYGGLRKVICKSIRTTDYVSSVEKDRMGLLLVETPRNGAEVLLNRLRSSVSGYFSSQSEMESRKDISYSIFSFPSDFSSKEEFSQVIRDFMRE